MLQLLRRFSCIFSLHIFNRTAIDFVKLLFCMNVIPSACTANLQGALAGEGVTDKGRLWTLSTLPLGADVDPGMDTNITRGH